MAQTAHFVTDVRMPVFCCDFTSAREVMLGGGGGGSKSGVKNRLLLYRLDAVGKALELKSELDLPVGEDAPMSISVDREAHRAVCGINSAGDQLSKGANEHLRIFSYADDRIVQESARQVLSLGSADTYQKTAVLSRSGAKLLAIGGTNGQFVLLSYPDLAPVGPPLDFGAKGEADEIVDVDFDPSGRLVLAASHRKMHVFSTEAKSSTGLDLVQNIERPVFKKNQACTFRAAKFGRGASQGALFTVVNSAAPVGARRKGTPRPAFLSAWDASSWLLKKTRKISQKPVTAFDISEDGKLLAVASSDLSIALLDAKTLRPVLSILRAHDFPVTCLRFSPDGTLLLSGSADNTVRVIDVKNRPSASSPLWTTVMVALLVLIIAIVLQSRGSEEVLQALRAHLHL